MTAVLQTSIGTADRVMERLAALDWAFEGEDTLAGGHGVHPYPAKFPPQMPRQIINQLSEPGDIVVDPFGGSGTTALEAITAGRRCISIDANPVGVRLTRAKVNGLDSRGSLELSRLIEDTHRLRKLPCTESDDHCPSLSAAPAIPNVSKWFAPTTIHELSHLRILVDALDGSARDVGDLALGQTAARVSYQESETRYVSQPRMVYPGETLEQFVTEIERIVARLPEGRTLQPNAFVAVHGDARALKSWNTEPGTVSLVVTSPPYPNAYDYHLYHRFRLLWTGAQPADLRRVEIGSHLRQQSVSDPVADYEADIRSVLSNAMRVLRPGGWCVLVVGDGKYNGKIYNTSDGIVRIGRDVGFSVSGVITRRLPSTRRNVTIAGRRLEQEQLVFLRKAEAAIVAGPAWEMADYEHDLSARELAVLSATSPVRVQDSTFASTVLAGGDLYTTTQAKIEAADGTRRKNSTYATHGIHRYKGKFYPQLGRCLINLSSTPGSLVVDPFAGSGTVGLEASLLGRRFHGIELSPLGAAVAKAKLELMATPLASIEEATRLLEAHIDDSRTVSAIAWSEFDTDTHDELRSWFAPAVLGRIARILKAVRTVEAASEEVAAAGRAARICLSDLIREVSDQDPADLRIRRRKTPLEDAPVEKLFLTRWYELTRKVAASRSVVGDLRVRGQIVQGDAANPQSWPVSSEGAPVSVDAVVSSPPYAAALPYLDTDRLSLAAVFGNDKRFRATLEKRLIGSREISALELRDWDDRLRSSQLAELLPESTSEFLVSLSDAVTSDKSAGFRRRQTPAVLARYFVAMSRVLGEISTRLGADGQVWYVLGDSRTTVGGRPQVIPTTRETVAIAAKHGLELVESIPISVTRENMRHARNAITENTLLHFRHR